VADIKKMQATNIDDPPAKRAKVDGGAMHPSPTHTRPFKEVAVGCSTFGDGNIQFGIFVPIDDFVHPVSTYTANCNHGLSMKDPKDFMDREPKVYQKLRACGGEQQMPRNNFLQAISLGCAGVVIVCGGDTFY